MSVMLREVRWRTVIGQFDGVAKLVLGVSIAASAVPVSRVGRHIRKKDSEQWWKTRKTKANGRSISDCSDMMTTRSRIVFGGD
jgi:hypothetical protein